MTYQVVHPSAGRVMDGASRIATTEDGSLLGCGVYRDEAARPPCPQSRSAGIGSGPAALPGSTGEPAGPACSWGFFTRTR